MKKALICAVALFFGFSVLVQAGPKDNWAAFQVGFWFGFPRQSQRENVNGLKLGIPICNGKGVVHGGEVAIFSAGTDTVRGFQFSWIGCNITEVFSGLQFALVNIAKKRSEGLQLGFVNSSNSRGYQVGFCNSSDNSPFQFGLLNFNRNGWLPFMVLVNFGKGTFSEK